MFFKYFLSNGIFLKMIVFSSLLITLSCKTNIPMTNTPKDKVITYLELQESSFLVQKDNISVTFRVQNNTNTDVTFCYWQTPLEKEFTADFFEIKHKGKLLEYNGALMKRKPPTEKDYITLKPNETKKQTIVINDAYNLNKVGTYSIQFLGSSINGLPNSQPISFIID